MSRIKKHEVIKHKLRDGKLLDYQYCEYNDLGQLEYFKEFSERGQIFLEKKYEYDNNLLIKESIINEFENLTITEKIYNELGELIKEIKTYEDGSFELVERTIDLLLEITTHFDCDGEETHKYIVYKDNNGFSIKYEEYISGELIFYNILKNDSSGKLIEKIAVYPSLEEEERETVKITYDSRGNEIEVNRYNELGELLDTESNSYDQNLLIKTQYEDHFDSHRNYCIEFKYNRRGKLLAETKKNHKKDIIYSYLFEYNEYGDKISFTEIEVDNNKNSLNEYVLEIEYY